MNAHYSDLTLCRRLLSHARPHWPRILGIFLFSLLAAPTALLVPLPMKIAVDSVLGKKPLPHFLDFLPAAVTQGPLVLAFAAVLLVFIVLLNQLQALGGGLLRTYTGERMVLDFRAQLFAQLQRLSLTYHDVKGTTDSSYRIQYDAPAIQWFAIDGIIPLLTAVFTLVSMLYITALLDRLLALMAVAVAPVLLLLARFYRRKFRRQWDKVKEVESSGLSVVQEALGAARVVKAFGQEGREHDRFLRFFREGLWMRVRLTLAQGGFSLVAGMSNAVVAAFVLFVGIHHVQTGVLTLGNLLLVMGYLAQISAPVWTISTTVATLQSAMAGAARVFSVLDEVPEVPEKPNARPLKRATGAIEFRNVSFAYDGKNTVLHDVSFKVDPGSRIGVAGTTGSGKTTLVNLLTRFYDPAVGQILLDGFDLRDYKIADLRNQISVVLQEPVLFSCTIAENIAYGRPGASEQEIVQAAKIANAHDFIQALSQGYGTLVGDRGVLLSGGERQRISLARAFLKDAPILILDEATSSVDLMTEAGIVEAMERLTQGRTTFIIAHRLSMLERCDPVLVIDSGRLVTVAESSATVREKLELGVRDLSLGNSQKVPLAGD